MGYLSIGEREKYSRLQNKWLDTGMHKKKCDDPTAYKNMDSRTKAILDGWVELIIGVPSQAQYCGKKLMCNELPLNYLIYAFRKTTIGDLRLKDGEMKGALLKHGFESRDINYNQHCLFNIKPSVFKMLCSYIQKSLKYVPDIKE